jgi:hypothetical protein
MCLRCGLIVSIVTITDYLQSRYKGFMRAIRQFRHIKMMKRAGQGNLEDGTSNTSPGELAVVCPACPYPGINLPNDWENVEPGLK